MVAEGLQFRIIGNLSIFLFIYLFIFFFMSLKYVVNHKNSNFFFFSFFFYQIKSNQTDSEEISIEKPQCLTETDVIMIDEKTLPEGSETMTETPQKGEKPITKGPSEDKKSQENEGKN